MPPEPRGALDGVRPDALAPGEADGVVPARCPGVEVERASRPRDRKRGEEALGILVAREQGGEVVGEFTVVGAEPVEQLGAADLGEVEGLMEECFEL
jgi:hypothetical protein